ncbi:hypothetical protein SAMN05216266_103276 [Amycolatopsis marina]|uniref:NTF2-like N-terminal transpeptidase domain-containing protein n=1 Tax=Amycolatopsis marina TaxID=490629 RepID=A0A1I0XK77_9PSEU|nr:hypothetical protein [Amycolatopsis marina]SFB01294.1 hypothetical protein SAMN05216266_103276 [Amycolatopsis marina]
MVAARSAVARSRLRRCTALLLIPLTAGTLVTACSGDEDAATQSLETFLGAWQEGSVPGHDAEYQQVTASLGGRTPELSAGEVNVEEGRASAPVTVAWTLAPDVRWE